MGEIKHKFCVGDRVIGNSRASSRYSLTKEGVCGIVVSTDPHAYVYRDLCRISGRISADADMVVEFQRVPNWGIGKWAVSSECFDLIVKQVDDAADAEISDFIDGF